MFDLENALLIVVTVMLTEFGKDGYQKLKEFLKSRRKSVSGRASAD